MDALGAYRSDSDDDTRDAPYAAEGNLDEDDVVVDGRDAFALREGQHARPSAVALAKAAPQATAPVVAAKVDEEAEARAAEEAAALPDGVTKTLSGYVEDASISDFDFRNQQRTFDVLGYARNPSDFASGSRSAFVGDRQAAQRMGGATAAELRGGDAEARALSRAMKRRRKGRSGDASVVDGEGSYAGPWGEWKEEEVIDEADVDDDVGPSAQELQQVEEQATQRRQEAAQDAKRRRMDQEHGSEKSIFHGKTMYDYQGRTFMHVPNDAPVNLHGETGEQQSFLPETCIHTWTGHTKGITAVRLFPRSGHLVLSASMDAKIKLWDVYREGKCLRTYMGHSKAVRDVCFSPDGRRFLSAGYDKQIKLWDTESGVCLKAFSNDQMPLCVRFHPDPDKQHIFLAGMANKTVVQYDIDEGVITQEYDQHTGAVNTVTFVDEGRRFVTTSDDKALRAWDFDIPVVIKYVADPSMHSMPSVTLDPSEKWLACQSMDNSIAVFSADTFKQRKKTFRGHTSAGFACEVAFSPDGRFLSSGDGQGNVVFWDWHSGKLLKRLSAHKQAIITHDWLPHETSKIVTGSWDGLIKLWT